MENELLWDFRADHPNSKWVTDISYIHTGQGFQYASQAYFSLTKEYRITPSTSKQGICYDNAMAENIFPFLRQNAFAVKKLWLSNRQTNPIDNLIYGYFKKVLFNLFKLAKI